MLLFKVWSYGALIQTKNKHFPNTVNESMETVFLSGKYSRLLPKLAHKINFIPHKYITEV